MHCGCTEVEPAAPTPPAPSSWRGRIGTLVEWAVPLAALAVIPKCPACVAGYVLLFTGVGLSLPAAAALRWVFIAVGTAMLGCLLLRTVRRALVPSRRKVRPSPQG